jgi:fucose 4-O-acetylase-like acetyltransferase
MKNETINRETKRNETVDCCKALGILMIVCGHVINRGFVWNLIYGFHIPLFVIISGFFHTPKPKELIRRLEHLLIAYTGYAFFNIFLWALIVDHRVVFVKQSIFNILMGGCAERFGIYPTEALWYIPCLSIITVVLFFFQKIENRALRCGCIALCVATGLFLRTIRSNMIMWFSFDVALVLTPFYFLGYKIKNNTDRLRIKEELMGLIIPFSAIYCIICFLNGYVNIYKGCYGASYFLLLVSGCLGSAIMAVFSWLLKTNTILIRKALSYIGRNTLVIMCTHQLFINLCREKSLISQHSPLLFLIGICFSLLLGWVLNIIQTRVVSVFQKSVFH